MFIVSNGFAAGALTSAASSVPGAPGATLPATWNLMCSILPTTNTTTTNILGALVSTAACSPTTTYNFCATNAMDTNPPPLSPPMKRSRYPTTIRFNLISGVRVGNLVRACAWCWPGETAYDAVPWAKGIPLTHSCCDFHLWLFELTVHLENHYGKINHHNT